MGLIYADLELELALARKGYIKKQDIKKALLSA